MKRSAFFERGKAMEFMDKQGYKYQMTQFIEDSKSYTMYMDKGRNRMSDFIYGDVNINVEKATYLPKDKALYSYGSLEYLKDPRKIAYLTTLYQESSISLF